MDFDRRKQIGSTGTAGAHEAPVPGKQTLTEGLVQLHPAEAGTAPALPPDVAPALAPETGHDRPTLQMLFGGRGAADDLQHVHAAAARGTSTASAQLPHLEQIQRSFGRHDVSGVKAHVGADAAASARDMGARAYATGDHVVLDGADLHTVAHEAAHVVQQRGGVQLKGGVGEHGDAYERHADAVADAVVRGESAEPLLGAGAGAPGSSVAIQRSGRGGSATKRNAAQLEHDDTQDAQVTQDNDATSNKRQRQSQLQIVDATSGASVAGRVPTIAGQPIQLRVNTRGGQLTDPSWVLPTSAVGGYSPSKNTAQITPVQNTASADIAFYLTAAGRHVVTINGLVDGVQDSTDIEFEVTKPDFTLTAKQGQTGIAMHDGIPKFQLLGLNSGITVTGRVTTGEGEKGVLTIVQLINAHVRHIADLNEIDPMYDEDGRTKPTPQQLALQANHTHMVEICKTNGWVLDNKYPYERQTIPANGKKTITAKDSPKYPIYPSVTKIDFQEQFRVYLMYQPHGGIPTTLGRLDWQHEAGVKDPNAASPDWYKKIPSATIDIVGQPSDELPEWSRNSNDVLKTEFQSFTSQRHG